MNIERRKRAAGIVPTHALFAQEICREGELKQYSQLEIAEALNELCRQKRVK
jgi:hypothetical protein